MSAPSGFCVDLDRFKEINDLFGHSAGDAVLCEASLRLKHPPQDTFLARVGGDEFIVITSDRPQPASVQALAERLRAAMANDIVAGGHSCNLTPTLGLLCFQEMGRTLRHL